MKVILRLQDVFLEPVAKLRGLMRKFGPAMETQLSEEGLVKYLIHSRLYSRYRIQELVFANAI